MDNLKDINIEKLRYDLLSYFETEMVNANPKLASLVPRIEKAGLEELIELAKDNKFDLNKYKK